MGEGNEPRFAMLRMGATTARACGPDRSELGVFDRNVYCPPPEPTNEPGASDPGGSRAAEPVRKPRGGRVSDLGAWRAGPLARTGELEKFGSIRGNASAMLGDGVREGDGPPTARVGDADARPPAVTSDGDAEERRAFCQASPTAPTAAGRRGGPHGGAETWPLRR